jgi:hypothetical protein
VHVVDQLLRFQVGIELRKCHEIKVSFPSFSDDHTTVFELLMNTTILFLFAFFDIFYLSFSLIVFRFLPKEGA